MDIIARSILHFVQSLEGREFTIIAGGAVRDEVFGLTPKDYDLCIPSRSGKDMSELARAVATEFNIKDMICKTKEYEHASHNGQNLTTVWGFSHEGKVFDLIGHKEQNDEDFANEVVNKFDFGVNMIHYDGSQIIDDNEAWKFDKEMGYMSLINMEFISSLPNAIARFNRFNDKLTEAGMSPLEFRAPCLELRGGEKKKELRIKKVFAPIAWTDAIAGNEMPITTASTGAHTHTFTAPVAFFNEVATNEVDNNF